MQLFVLTGWRVNKMWEDIYKCPACDNAEGVPPHNPSKSKILIVGDFPEGDDITQGIPFRSRIGTVLQNYLSKMGYSLSQFGLCNLWQHAPDKVLKNKPVYNNPDCLEHGKKVVIEEAKKKKLILLIGSNVSKVFLTKNSMEMSSLKVNEHLKIQLSAPTVLAMVKPSIVFGGTHGEVELALKKFIKQVEKIHE